MNAYKEVRPPAGTDSVKNLAVPRQSTACTGCGPSDGARWLLLLAEDARNGDPDALRLLPRVREHYQALETRGAA